MLHRVACLQLGTPIRDLSIPGLGIETFLIPGLRHDHYTTYIPRVNHRPQFTHKSGHGLVRTWYCYIEDAKQVKQR
jgi:hypothetical protein